MPKNQSAKLVRAIGRWSLTALMVNVIIGSGIFGLPAIIGKLLGTLAPWAYIVAVVGVALVAGCFAEVGSQFAEAGGPYLYARVCYGRFAGIQVAWLALLVRITSGAASANIFVEYLGGFFPRTHSGPGRVIVLLVLIAGLAAINIVGVKNGANVSNLFALVKILPLVVFAVAGMLLLRNHVAAQTNNIITPTSADWFSAILLLVFAFSGFEAALFPMGEARDARHDVPFAILFSLILCAVLYTLIQVVVLRALGVAPATGRPLAEAARLFLGSGGSALMQVGALLSVSGHLSSLTLNSPRLCFALAERGDFPSIFAAVSTKFRTPYVAIASFSACMFGLALAGTFRGNAVLSAVARLFTYAVVCAAVITLRNKQPDADAFRLPAGPLISVLALAFVLLLISHTAWGEILAIICTMAVAVSNYLWIRWRERRLPRNQS